MTTKKSYSSHAACLPRRSRAKAGVLDCGGRDAAFPDTVSGADRRILPLQTVAVFGTPAECFVPFSSVASTRRSLFASFRLCGKKVEIAKRTQFHSKHIVLQMLTTKIFLFSPKANLMIPDGVPGGRCLGGPLLVCRARRKKIKNAKRTQIEKCINRYPSNTNAKTREFSLKKRTQFYGLAYHKITAKASLPSEALERDGQAYSSLKIRIIFSP